MKSNGLIKYIFLITSIGLLIGAFFAYQSTQEFIKNSVEAPASVVELIGKLSTDSDGNRNYTYYPLIQFQTATGEKIEFQSNIGSYPASYHVGEAIEVLYLMDSPQTAKIKSFTSLWLLPLILGSLGLIDFFLGVGLIIYGINTKKKIAWLHQFGTPLQTKFTSVEHNTSYKVNGRSPYRIFSQTQENGQIYVFKSENLWFDPTSYLQKDQEITVVVDPQNMKKYLMDLSFLPELKN